MVLSGARKESLAFFSIKTVPNFSGSISRIKCEQKIIKVGILPPYGAVLAPDGPVLAPDGEVLAPDGEVLDTVHKASVMTHHHNSYTPLPSLAFLPGLPIKASTDSVQTLG